MSGPGEPVPRVRDDREQTHPLARQGRVGDEQRPETGLNPLCPVGQCVEPGPPATRQRCRRAHRISPLGQIWRNPGPSSGPVGSIFARRRR